MQWAAFVLLVLLLAGGTLWARARQGRLPRAWRTVFERETSGLRVLDRVPLSAQSALVRIELPDGTRLTLAVGTTASVLHEEPPTRPRDAGSAE
jgi:flagellar biogenesis protein FliO